MSEIKLLDCAPTGCIPHETVHPGTSPCTLLRDWSLITGRGKVLAILKGGGGREKFYTVLSAGGGGGEGDDQSLICSNHEWLKKCAQSGCTSLKTVHPALKMCTPGAECMLNFGQCHGMLHLKILFDIRHHLEGRKREKIKILLTSFFPLLLQTCMILPVHICNIKEDFTRHYFLSATIFSNQKCI